MVGDCGCDVHGYCDHWEDQILARYLESIEGLEEFATRAEERAKEKYSVERIERALRARRQVVKEVARLEKDRAYYASEEWRLHKARVNRRRALRDAREARRPLLTVLAGGAA